MQVSTLSADDTQRSALLKLPFELRCQILRLVVTQAETIDLCSLETRFSIDARVLSACKQLRDEARPLLYNENTLEVGINSTDRVAILQFTRQHSLCEFAAQEEVADIVSTFFKRFSRFRFRFSKNAISLSSLYRALAAIQSCFDNKHVTVVLPQRREEGWRARRRATLTLGRTPAYPHIDGQLSCFSIIRCASFSVVSPVADHDISQYEQLIELVTSKQPVIDMTFEFDKAQRTSRYVDRMLLPDGLFPEFERLSDEVFKHLRGMSDSARTSNQATFLREREEFYRCYREVGHLQWRLQ